MTTPDATEGRGDAVVESNAWLAPIVGTDLVQFRMGGGIHLELGDDFEATVETSLSVSNCGVEWAGEPLTGEAAGAILPLLRRELTRARIEPDGTLRLSFGDALLTVQPDPAYEAWQIRGPRNLLIVCSPGGAYVALFRPGGEA